MSNFYMDGDGIKHSRDCLVRFGSSVCDCGRDDVTESKKCGPCNGSGKLRGGLSCSMCNGTGTIVTVVKVGKPNKSNQEIEAAEQSLKFKKPHLVQRMNIKLRSDCAPNAKGVDLYFSFDYMGASEFEWGALKQSLTEIRSWQDPIVVAELHYGKHRVFFVGREKDKEAVQNFFNMQLEEKKYGESTRLLKEPIYLKETYEGTTANAGRQPFDGWWCIDKDFAWCLFRDKQSVGYWLNGLNNK